MKIAIIGSGVVGSATGKGLSTFNNDVVFYDVNQTQLDNLKAEGFKTSNDLDSLTDADVYFICVPTPDVNEQIDLSYIKDAITKLSHVVKNRTDYFLIVIKSTIIPGTTDKTVIPIIEEITNKKVNEHLGVCFNPEFLNESHPLEDVLNPDRIVIGSNELRSGNMLEKIYSRFTCPIVRTNIITAEMVKYANNCFNATKISFFNEMKMMCDKIGVDSILIRKVVQMDRFYGVHPWEHGHAFGGKCLPKDLNAIISMFNHNGIHNPILLKAVRDINEKM